MNTLYEEQFERLKKNTAQKPDEYFSIHSDPFRKDIAFLLHRLIPCGAEFATPHSGIARSLIFRKGGRQALTFLRAIREMGGTAPLLELHMHPEVTQRFNPAGWTATYEILADLLELNSNLLGVQSTSWFLDPEITRISPRLAYLRNVPEQCGAFFLFAGLDDGEHSGALQKSEGRRKLYLAGHYQPARYTRLWSRSRILDRHWR